MHEHDHIPRDGLRKQLEDSLQRGSVLLYGPRRVGKSTLIERVAFTPPHGMTFVVLDLEGMLQRPIEGLAAEVHRELSTSWLQRAKEAADRLESVEALGTGLTVAPATEMDPWQRLRADILAYLDARTESTLVLALDEVPWWLDAIVEQHGAPAARAALASLRRLRQDGRLSGRLRMVLTGSIGLAGMAASLGASAELNDLSTLIVPPMQPDEGRTLFEMELISRGIESNKEAAKLAVKLAGGSPHWIKRLAAGCEPKGAVSAEDVDRAVDALLVPSMRHQFADEGIEHFRRRHPDLQQVLVAMLGAASETDRGVLRVAVINAGRATMPALSAGRVNEALNLLLDGFYLREGPDQTLEWVNPIFRRWWCRYGGL